MRGVNSRLVIAGIVAIVAGILIALLVASPPLRLLGSATGIVIGFSLFRQAFRIE